MDAELQKLDRRMTWSFAVTYSLWLLSIAIIAASPPGQFIPFLTTWCLVLIASVVYLVSLGRVAAKTGRSWIVWCGLSVLFAPIGGAIAFFVMRLAIRDAPSLVPGG